MAKTDWNMNDTVKPEDMNDIGEEINQNTADLEDIKTPDPSYTPDRPIDKPGDMTRDLQARVIEHLDDYAQLVATKVIDSSGSNNDGEWIRFADGTQICWYQHDWGYNHTADELKTDTWTFPMPFSQVSSVSATLANRAVGESGGANQANAITGASRRNSSSMSITDCTIFFRALFTHSNSYQYSTLTAKGRWKL